MRLEVRQSTRPELVNGKANRTSTGLFVRPPQQGEEFANWKQSVAGMKENESGWVYVPQTPGVFTVFPGK